MFIFMQLSPAHRTCKVSVAVLPAEDRMEKDSRWRRPPVFLHHTMWYRAAAWSGGMAQEEDDHLRPTQEELMTPESTSSVFPLRTNTAGAPSRLLLLLLMYHRQNLLTVPQSTPHITLRRRLGKLRLCHVHL